MFIAFDKETKKVYGEPSNIPFARVTTNLTIAEVKEIPTYNKITQFLTAINEREEVEITTYQDEEGNPLVDENDNIVATERKYLTCDLVVNEKPPIVLTAKQKQAKYDKLVRKYIREKYSQHDVEALMANYLSENVTEKAKLEWQSFQDYRVECKVRANKEVYGE